MNAPWCQRCGVSETHIHSDDDPHAVELRVISDHLGSIRDLLALISREMPDQRERLVAASLGPLLVTGMEPRVAARIARVAADAALKEFQNFLPPKHER